MYSQLYEYNELLLLNLKFGREDMKKLAAKFGYVSQALDGKPVLKGADAEFIASYCSNLGSTDASSQIDYLNERKSYIKNIRKKVLPSIKNAALCTSEFFLCSAC